MDFPERDVRRQCELTHIASRRNVIGNHGSPLVFRAQRSPMMLSHVRCLSAAHCLPDRGTDRSALRHRRRLGLADALADGPKDPDALAREVGAHADMMNRLMRALASFGVFEQLSDGRFANTSSSEYLRSDAPGSLRGLAILRANPGIQGVLFDLPHVIERGREYLPRQGVAGRCRTETGSFFDAIPTGADAYFMKHIIHDWGDEDCVRILRNCKTAMPDHAKLLVCEKVVPPGIEPSVAKTMDLVMLVLTDGGRERSEQEFRDLFARAGLRLARVVPTRVDNSSSRPAPSGVARDSGVPQRSARGSYRIGRGKVTPRYRETCDAALGSATDLIASVRFWR
jgi:hypothetical protein